MGERNLTVLVVLKAVAFSAFIIDDDDDSTVTGG